MITSLSKKKKKGRKKGKEKKEKGNKLKGKGKKKGKKEKIGKDGFWFTQENKQNLFGEKIIIFSQVERISKINFIKK